MSKPLDFDEMRKRAYDVLTGDHYVNQRVLAGDLWQALNALGRIATWFDEPDMLGISPELQDVIAAAKEHHVKHMAAVAGEGVTP